MTLKNVNIYENITLTIMYILSMCTLLLCVFNMTCNRVEYSFHIS